MASKMDLFTTAVGLLVKKDRAEAMGLKEDEIVREIDYIKLQLNALARLQLLTSITFFREGMLSLFKLFNRSKRSEHHKKTDQSAQPERKDKQMEVCALADPVITVSRDLKDFKMANLDKEDLRVLSTAKDDFKQARIKATEAFNNEALSPLDRIQAIAIRVAAKILENIDHPDEALPVCRLCLEDLHSLKEVQESFGTEINKGFSYHFNKEERREIISLVCRINRAIYDVTSIVAKSGELLSFPLIDNGRELVDPLHDLRVAQILARLDVEHYSVKPLSLAPQEIFARGPIAVQAYQKALLEGETKVMRLPIMFIGQGQSGKTSLKKSLKGKRYDPKEKSTEAIEMDPSYCKVSTEAWKLGTDTDQAPISYEQCTAQYMLSDLKEERRQPASRHVMSDIAVPDDGPSANLDDKEHSSVFYDAQRTRTPEATYDTPLTLPEVPNAPQLSEVPEEIAGLIERLLQAVDREDDEEVIYSVLWDFGGQSVYYNIHPLFLTSRAMYCLVYNLNWNPDEMVTPRKEHGFYRVVEDVFCERSNMDYLDFWMSSVSSLVSQDEDPEEASASEILPERLPPVFLVCTHADKPYQDTDPKELGREIFGSLQKKHYGKHLHDVFVVDNTKSASGQECPEVTRLRTEVLNVAKELPQMKDVIPIKWLKYEKSVRVLLESGKKWISLDEARKIALDVCGISSDEQFLALLNFLHDQRILIHFDDTPEVNKMVILDPQWLVDVIKKIITITPYQPKEKIFKEAWLRLESEGVLEEKLLQRVWGPLFDNRETCNSLIAMMERFSLLCHLWPSQSEGRSSPEYLVPSMLKFPPKQNVAELIRSSGMPSLCVKFKSGQVPPGLFPRLVLIVFQWCTKEWPNCQTQPQLHHNYARFFTHPVEGCSLILFCHSSFIEVVVHKEDCSFEQPSVVPPDIKSSSDSSYDVFQVTVARTVCRQLGLIFECMRKEFPWCKNMACEMSVCCPVCCKQGSVNFCHRHNIHDCKEEECLHFLKESELRAGPRPITCTKSAFARNYAVPLNLIGHWFTFLDEQRAINGSERALPCKEGDLEQALALPSGVLDALQSQTCNTNDVVARLQESLSLDQASLVQPDPETKRRIRCLCMKAKSANRFDVVERLRKIVPDGTTGPLLPEALDVKSIPFRQRRELTIDLSGRDEWKFLAEKLGLSQSEIRFLDKRILNPCDAVLAHSRNQGYITSVADLYDKLVECELPIIADLL